MIKSDDIKPEDETFTANPTFDPERPKSAISNFDEWISRLEYPEALLEVFDCRCFACGHTWATSSLLFRNADGLSYNYGMSQEQFDSARLHPHLVKAVRHHESMHPCCFRCVDIQKPNVWPTRKTFYHDHPTTYLAPTHPKLTKRPGTPASVTADFSALKSLLTED